MNEFVKKLYYIFDFDVVFMIESSVVEVERRLLGWR